MLFFLGQHQRCASGLQACSHISQDLLVADFALHHGAAGLIVTELVRIWHKQTGKARVNEVLHILRGCAVLGGITVADRPKLHKNFLFLPIVTLGRGRQTVDIFGADGVQYILSNGSPGVMAFIHNDHAIVFDQCVHSIALPQRGDHSDIYDSPKSVAPAGQRADEAGKLFMPPFWGDVLRQGLVDLKEFLKILQPVFHDFGIMNQYQGVDLALRHKVCTDRRFAESRGGAEHTCVLRQPCSGGLCLRRV